MREKERQTSISSSSDGAITIYYWHSGFLLLAKSFVLERPKRPYSRLSATIMLGLKKSFVLEMENGETIQARAVLVPPKLARRRLIAQDCDFVICDVAVATPEWQALSPLLETQLVQVLDEQLVDPLLTSLSHAADGSLESNAVRELVHRIIFQFSGQVPTHPQLHPRIQRAVDLLQDASLGHVTPQWIADRVHLSASRLRQLFADQLGGNLSQYLRRSTVYRAVWLWSNGKPLIEIAEPSGFYDLAHMNRAFNEVLGVNPTEVMRPDQIRLIRCPNF